MANASPPASVQKAPAAPGVYFFRSVSGKILYVGKAANLRSRLRSHFAASAEHTPAKRALLVTTAKITWETTENDVEALIREAELIKRLKPKYNVLLRDDKKYFFVGFTKEELPRIFLTHQPHLRDAEYVIRGKGRKRRTLSPIPYSLFPTYIGPFTDGRSIKRTLKLLRRIFPYAMHSGFPKHCLEYHLQLCPIPPAANSEWRIANSAAYQRNIRTIKAVLTGKRTALIKQLGRDMRRSAKRGDFETAARRRDEIRGLEKIFAHRTVLERTAEHALAARDIPIPLRTLFPHSGRTGIVRIEGYDVANLARGKFATGAMVVFSCARMHADRNADQRGYRYRPESAGYRQFRIKTVRGANDVAMLAEVLKRRFAHREWPLPDLILIDGGKPQLNAAVTALVNSQLPIVSSERKQKILARNHMPLAVISLAKRNEEIYLPGRKTPLRLPKSHPFLKLLMHVRDEAHRFARRYHHAMRGYRDA